MQRLLLCGFAVVAGMYYVDFANAAPNGEKPDPEAVFKKMDKDGDGKLTLAEFIGKRTGDKEEKAKMAFEKKDKDKDGHLTLEEFKGKPKKDK